MTPDDIRKLKPGRDTDAMVAGVLKILARHHADGTGDEIDWPAFTANTPWGWAASRECWEWLLCRGWLPTLDYSRQFQGKPYSASAVHESKPRFRVHAFGGLPILRGEVPNRTEQSTQRVPACGEV